MSNGRKAIYAAVFGVAMIALIAFLGPGGRNYEPYGLHSFAPNGLKIWRETMEHYGAKVTADNWVPDAEDAPNSTVLVTSYFLPDDTKPLLEYVRDGGTLILDGNVFEDQDPYMQNVPINDDRFIPNIKAGLTFEPSCDEFETYQVGPVAFRNVAFYPPSVLPNPDKVAYHSTACFPVDAEAMGNDYLAKEDPEIERLQREHPGLVVRNEYGSTSYAMVSTTYGKGKLIRLASIDFLTNDAIVEHDNGVFGYRLFEGRPRIHVIHDFSKNPLDGEDGINPFPEGAFAGIVVLFIAYWIAVAAAFLRPGRVVEEPLLERRQAHESTIVIGDMLRTTKNFKMAATVLQAQVRKDASRRTGIPETDQAELVAAVRAQTNLDAELITTLLYRDVVNSNDEFVTFAKSITTLRKLLKAVAQGRY